jgi:hypothetical protein
MRKIERFALAGLGLLSLMGVSVAGDPSVQVLRQDLAFYARCESLPATEIERAGERFLIDRGFRVLNVAKVQHAHNIDTLFAVDLLALDDKSRIVSIESSVTAEKSNTNDERFAVTLRTRPPTRRSEELESALLGMFSITLSCEIRQITRGFNGADVAGLHDREREKITKKLDDVAMDQHR